MRRFDFSIIRNLRKKWGLTAEGLARRANLTRATVAKIEGGNANPTIDTIEALSSAFQLSSSELIRLAELAQCETASTKSYKVGQFEGVHVWFPKFELYHIRAAAGVRQEADPQRHDNTAEVCLVLSGRVRVTVGNQSYELGPGMAIRFKALYEHYYDVMEEAEMLLIHHSFV